MGICRSAGVASLDLQNRAPSVTRTQDFRNHVERRFDVLNEIPKSPAQILAECWLPLGTVDDEYTDCYLISQIVEGQKGDFYQPCVQPPVLFRVFEQLNGLNETQIGQAGVLMDQYGNRTVTFEYWQLSLGTATYQIPGTTVAPAPFTDCILKTEERTNSGTLVKIIRNYINSGILSETDDIKYDGKLLVKIIKSLGTVPATPSGYSLVTTDDEFVAGRTVYTYTFCKGDGVYEEIIQTRSDGLREVTWASLGTRTPPPGIVIRDEYRDWDIRVWAKLYNVTTLQAADGGDVTSAILTFDRLTEFFYPGRAKITVVTPAAFFPVIDIYQSPPIQSLVPSTVTITYQTSNVIGVISPTLWNPVDWAVLRADWVQPNSWSGQLIRPLNGYINAGTSLLTIAIDAFPYAQANVFGNITEAVGGTGTGPFPFPPSYYIHVNLDGGPGDPGGNTYTLEYRIEPAFTDIAGVQYYRVTKVIATIPAQPALPV